VCRYVIPGKSSKEGILSKEKGKSKVGFVCVFFSLGDGRLWKKEKG
jgi:hypothetical protein